jgi:Tfp pilus assembly protein FimT
VNGEGLMKRAPRQDRTASAGKTSAGFTLMELLIGIAIVMIMTAIALPMLQSGMAYFRLRGAISSITGAIQSTRYQAIVQGIPYQVVFDSTAKTYQIQNQPGGAGAFVNVCVPAQASCPVPLSGSGMPVTLDVDTTLTFSPGGRVSSTNPANKTVPITMVITYTGKPPESIQVSTYGNINVTP